MSVAIALANTIAFLPIHPFHRPPLTSFDQPLPCSVLIPRAVFARSHSCSMTATSEQGERSSHAQLKRAKRRSRLPNFCVRSFSISLKRVVHAFIFQPVGYLSYAADWLLSAITLRNAKAALLSAKVVARRHAPPAGAVPPRPLTAVDAESKSQTVPDYGGAITESGRIPMRHLPSRMDIEARQLLIRRLVLADAEGQFKRFVRSFPWAAGEGLQRQLHQLERRSPLLQWAFNWHSPLRQLSDFDVEQAAAECEGDSSSNGEDECAVFAKDAKERRRRRAEELWGAIKVVASPAFFELIAEASRVRPSSSRRLGRRVARAGLLIAWWQSAAVLRLARRRRFRMMNDFLSELAETLDECHEILESESSA